MNKDIFLHTIRANTDYLQSIRTMRLWILMFVLLAAYLSDVKSSSFPTEYNKDPVGENRVHDISDEDDLQSLREKKPFILRGKRPFLLRGKRPFIMRGKRPFKLRGKRPFMLKGKMPFILRGKRPFLLGNPQFFEDTKRAPEVWLDWSPSEKHLGVENEYPENDALSKLVKNENILDNDQPQWVDPGFEPIGEVSASYPEMKMASHNQIFT